MSQEQNPDRLLASLLSSVKDEKRSQIEKDASTGNSEKISDKATGSILTKEEKSFFFGKPSASQNGGVEVSVVDENPELYEELLIAPSGKEARRTQFLHLLVLGLLLILIAVLCYQQFGLRRDIAELKVFLLTTARAETTSRQGGSETYSDLIKLPWSEQKLRLESRLSSPWLSRQEQVESYFLLATFAFAEGLYAEGREYLVEGVRLRDEQ
jgi:hypothetical protein